MEEIKVDEYVRFETGQIDKIINIECWADDDIWLVGQNSYTKTTDDVIVKHSKNIIDLIEVGDIVELLDVLNNDVIYIWSEDMLKAVKEDVENGIQIKSILTKESYENTKYEVIK